ncbi:sce7725 family protein [Paenibacillus gorillae]|uniref:sce7725 family protein n=1 Tax=Paenibacillus gorillae TaxID=1243662 RepID=UPI0012DEA41F
MKKSFKDLDDYCIHGYESGNVNYQSDKQNIAIIHRNQDSLVNDSSNLIYNIFMPEVLRFQTYINQYNQGKSVLVEDGFIKHEPNSDYPSHEDFNSELCFTYKNKNVLGFGDFTILENGYQPSGGGKADSVTHVIHLTKKETASTKDKIVVYHYLTTPSEEADNKRRSAKTIAKAYNSRTQFLYTSGIKLIEGKYPNGTSLGMYKRIGVAHHIELIHSLI